VKLVLICYDIADDRRRLKVARLLEAHGARVQESVFEAHLTSRQLRSLLEKVVPQLDAEEDTLRVYHLCRDCAATLQVVGAGQATRPPSLVIV